MAKLSKPARIVLISVLSVIGLFIILVCSYVLYVVLQFNRIEDNLALTTQNKTTAIAKQNTPYSMITYNIGFGAYSPEYSFFLDSGIMENGKKVNGKYGKGISQKDVQKNTDGCVELVKSFNADFALIQEVDEKADRSYNINQLEALRKLSGYASTYAENFHSAYLFYPFNDPHGKSNAGLVTLSKFDISSAIRRSFPIDDGLPKFFDLDRCFSVNKIPVEGGKTLSLINLHMSAYDEGGTIRAQQLKMLNDVLKIERDSGNYVIAGGDFNHDIAKSKNIWPSTEKVSDAIYPLSNENLTTGFSFAAAVNAPTCRSACIPYQKGVGCSIVVDGFIVSDNVTVSLVENLDSEFKFSDHNPATMKFLLNS